MTTEEILRTVTLNELGLLILVALTIAGTVAVLRYVDRWWTFYPRKRQRQSFGERRYL